MLRVNDPPGTNDAANDVTFDSYIATLRDFLRLLTRSFPTVKHIFIMVKKHILWMI